MRTLRTFLTISCLLPWTVSVSQDSKEIEEVVSKLHSVFISDSAEFHFELDSMDPLFIERLEKLHNSLVYYPLTETLRDSVRKPSRNFMADNDEPWRSGDFINSQNQYLPERKFLFGVTEGDWTIVFYKHGGSAAHLHIVLGDRYRLTIFLTLNKTSEIIWKADNKGKLKEISSYGLSNLANSTDVRYFDDRVIKDSCNF